LDLGAALTETWATLATVLLDGFGRALTTTPVAGDKDLGAADE
jgi:hypothetical protein